jgi:PAS domain-containing protein
MSRFHRIFESDFGGGADAGGPATSAQLSCDALFTASSEPILIIDAASGRITEANPSAVELLRTSHGLLIDAPLQSALDQHSAALIDAGLALALLRGGTHTLHIPSPRGGQALRLRVSLFWTGTNSYFLIRLGSDHAGRLFSDPVHPDSTTFRLIDEAPVGFLITDVNLQIDYANRAFIAMIDLASGVDVRGKSLKFWLHLNAAELAALQMQLCQRQAVSRLRSSLRCSPNGVRQVEVHAIAVPDDQAPCWGFSVHALRMLN